ncbi:heavy-metal-associated domain-containing protein [Sulfitobacter sp. F26204]|jgi:copper chaperone|uniref:heavy-metal-associated domain-containing protein n=1 Tax=Sulfitobacter sp. F26204 TaxID=2996014 RepID=UPI00225DEC1A|nr:heavy-metal-associated domain-containing protein [Sulfitobacter sp. F26204]MCX7561490.1 heavy-metal-associated domain-containing protein [Sulfitobacter sp. F26204]
MTRFSVPQMTCGHCKSSIEKAVASVDADAVVEVDLTTREVSVRSDANTEMLIEAMKSAGYDAHFLS